MSPVVSSGDRNNLFEGSGIHLLARDASVPNDTRGVHDERRGAGDVDRVVRKGDVHAPTPGARAVVVDQDREGERMFLEPCGDVVALLAEHDQDVEAVGPKLFEAFAQLRDAAHAVGSPGAAMELDQERARASGGEIEGVARRSLTDESEGGFAGDHGAILTATVSPSRNGTRVVTKSVSA